MILRPLRDGDVLPWLVEPRGGRGVAPVDEICDWLRAHPDDAEDALLRHRALLLRGFEVESPGDFQRVADALGPPHDYIGGNSPRSQVIERVWTSTEYPRNLDLAIHNEMAYLDRYPSRIALCCLQPAAEGGETPIADGRRIFGLLPPTLADKLVAKKISYVRNLHGGGGTGLTWQASFGTEDRATVEARCREDGATWQWTARGDLRTQITRDAFATHPKTRERVWFNQIVLWHHTSLEPKLRDIYAARGLGPDDFPHDCRYGDGSPIPDDEATLLRESVARATIVFPWQKSDILLVDNLLVGHGRRPFRGERRILVSLFA